MPEFSRPLTDLTIQFRAHEMFRLRETRSDQSQPCFFPPGDWFSQFRWYASTGEGSRTGLRKDPGEEQVEADPGGSKGRTENSKFQLQSDAGKNRGPADVQIGRLCPVSTVDALHDLEDRHGILILCYDPKRKGIKGLQRYKCEDYVQFQLPISQST